ncbi:hypothetical protein Dimus_028111 [Dionaea muscipula]
MVMAYTGTLTFSGSTLHVEPLVKVRKQLSTYSYSSSSSSSSSLNCSVPSPSSTERTSESSIQVSKSQEFSYTRASPSVRWPSLKLVESSQAPLTELVGGDGIGELEEGKKLVVDGAISGVLGRARKERVKGANNLELAKDGNRRNRAMILADRILGLPSEELVEDVLDSELGRMTPSDYCFLMKFLGQSSWQRALEVYQWLDAKHLDVMNAQMVAVILSVLGKANQEVFAVEIFTRTQHALSGSARVYNAMMGVYARSGKFTKVEELLNVMRERGCEPDIITFNTVINARLKSGPMEPNLAIDLLNEVRRSRIQPDTITYNTLISACSRGSNLQEAVRIYCDMEAHGCPPDLWTYNAMISVFGRCGLASKADSLLKKLKSTGFLPDAVTYNSVLYAFAREGNVEKVRDICMEMMKRGFEKCEMTYNTIIHMYGKKGEYELALQLYRDMKLSGRSPDAVTYTVLIDSLGKGNKMREAANLMSEMLDSGVKPNLCTYSALICGYGKAGKLMEAREIIDCMLKSGIKPDHLAYSVMVDVLLRSNKLSEALMLYKEMVLDGFVPNHRLYLALVREIKKEQREHDLQRVIVDMEELSALNPLDIYSVLVQGECYDAAAKMLRSVLLKGYNELDRENLMSILNEYSSSGRHSEAQELLNYLYPYETSSRQQLEEAFVVVLCKAKQLDAAMFRYREIKGFGLRVGSSIMYESLIKCCEESELYGDASQIFSDLMFYGLEPTEDLYRIMVHVYCRMSFPETAQKLIDEAEVKGIMFTNVDMYVGLIDAYGKCKEFKRAEGVVGRLRQRSRVVDRKVWNALVQAYAASGCYERARAAFNTMMTDGPAPTVDTIDALIGALIVDGRSDELYVVIQELQDMGFKIGKSTITLMLDAFVRAGSIFEVKKLYHGMKAAGYVPTLDLYRDMIVLLSRGKQVRDVSLIVAEMEEAGLKPDLVVWNSLLKMYTNIQDHGMAAEIYNKIQKYGLKPDADTYNTLIIVSCRDRRPEEGLRLMHEMRKLGMDPTLDAYKSLIAALGKQQMLDQAKDLFDHLHSKGYKLDRSFYHLMIRMYRNSGSYSKAEELLILMNESGLEPSAPTHMLMMSFGSGQPKEAEMLLNNLKSRGFAIGTLQYVTVIDAYLKNGDYNAGIQKLMSMRKDGLEPDHRIWTCFIRAASLCQRSSEALFLLKALENAEFNLPIRLLTVESSSLVLEVDCVLERLQAFEGGAAFNFVNALEDLLWAFELRAAASWVFQLALKRKIYRHDVFRVTEKDWGADFRKLSAGAALVGLTLWLDCMQGASLEGSPGSPKSVVLLTGAAEYNMVSLNSTVKAFLWEMGSPFFPCKGRSGILLSKGHSLSTWLKDSPFCFDLELRNAPSLPKLNSMRLINGCWMRRGLVPAFNDITTRLGEVQPKKFARLARLSDEKRDHAIQADIQGREAKLEKMKRRGMGLMARRTAKHQRRKICYHKEP